MTKRPRLSVRLTPVSYTHLGAQVSDYTAAPVYMDSNAKCRHQWLIEFSQEPASLDEFASLLDQKPVSYTHLDVYKRQVHTACGKE